MTQFKDKRPFTRYHEKKQSDTFNVYLNTDEREMLNRAKLMLEQPKDSTALKTLAKIGANMLVSENMTYIITTIFKNKRNNERIGIAEIE